MRDLDDAIRSYEAGTLSRRAFAHRLLGLGLGMGFVETLLGPSIHRALAAPAPEAPAKGPYVVLVVMDAFRADYMHLAPMPNFHWLMDRGTFYANAWVGHLESNTVPSHATISSGATPTHQGVIGFDWRDPVTGQETYTGWHDDVIAGRLEAQLVQHGVDSIPQAMKRLDPAARVVSVSSEKYYAADAMGGAAADYIVYGHVENGMRVPRGIPRHVPPADFLARRDLTGPWPPRSYQQLDRISMTMALAAFQRFHPRLLMINLPACDYYGHRVGGPATPAVMETIVAGCDRQLGRLIKTLRDRRILDRTILVVAADHGMVPNTHRVDETALKDAIRAAGGDYLFHTPGNCAYIWLRNPSASLQVAQHLVDTIPHAPFAHVQTVESGNYTYHPVSRTGSALGPALERAYQYLLTTLEGPLAPDIMLSFRENTIITSATWAHGEHSGPTWGTQQIPLLIAGPGVRKRHHSVYPARLMDIAPTVLTLLGTESTKMDGVALADALVRPTTQQEKAQADLSPVLHAAQQAIIARSKADLSRT